VAFVGGAVAVDPTRTTAGTRVWLASGAEPEIEVRRADGTLERIVRWTPPSRALTDAHIARYREYLLGSTSNPDTRRRHVQFMDGVPMPQQLPALGDAPMHVDTNGHLWAEAYRPPWDAEPEWNACTSTNCSSADRNGNGSGENATRSVSLSTTH
jgi:hypothetical protein